MTHHDTADFQTGMKAYERSDFTVALHEFRLLAEQGNVEAQGVLGFMYANGEGLPQDDVQAYIWFNIAAAQGNKDAEAGKGIAAESMTREGLAHAQKLARKYWEKYVLPFRN